MKYICVNGEFRRSSEPFLFPGNRAFRYGDSLCENIHVYATEPQFLEHHYSRLICGMNLLVMDIPAWFTQDYLHGLIVQLLNRNRIFGGGRIRLTVYREAGDNLVPESNHISFILESQTLPDDFYVLNDRGFAIDLCQEYRLHTSPFSGIKTTGSLINVMTGLFCGKNHLDDAILLNESGRISGTGHSNIFLINGSSVFTPGLNQGCTAGVMRRVIIELSGDSGFRVNEQSSLTPAVLEDADEVFLTNALTGIRWAGAYRQRRYYKKTAQLLTRALNEKAFGKKGLR